MLNGVLILVKSILKEQKILAKGDMVHITLQHRKRKRNLIRRDDRDKDLNTIIIVGNLIRTVLIREEN